MLSAVEGAAPGSSMTNTETSHWIDSVEASSDLGKSSGNEGKGESIISITYVDSLSTCYKGQQRTRVIAQ